jgi:hypothetical protein
MPGGCMVSANTFTGGNKCDALHCGTSPAVIPARMAAARGNDGFFRRAAALASQEPSLLILSGANDGVYETRALDHAGHLKLPEEKNGILRAAATRETSAAASKVRIFAGSHYQRAVSVSSPAVR